MVENIGNLPIIWHETAVNRLKEIYDYIALDSKTNAKKVVTKIKDLVASVAFFPEKSVRLSEINPELGNFRSLPIYSYRIIYQITEKEIVVLDIFHTSQNPEKISKLKMND